MSLAFSLHHFIGKKSKLI
ncbi:MAG: hypothetical protein ACERKD_16930 [Prolixibacteraceae bacterium]